ncbi:MAG: hypothetical protein OEY01_09850 [Desulfobulbaceae bacterium]|nr:hypothetical protein [Desulfobulbaceae bacterium]HIJ79275.1 hypothetical protein [Deltaproteobacteria bacterium]
MQDAIAIAKAKIKEKFYSEFPPYPKDTDLTHHVSKAGLSALLLTGAIIGFGGFSCMIVAFASSGGIMNFITGWLTSISVF